MWPPFFPDSSLCPPHDAVPAQGQVYRLVDKIPARMKDFRPVRLLNSSKTYETVADECEDCGLSVDDNLANLLKMQAVIGADAKGFMKKVPTLGTLVPAFGMMKSTPDPVLSPTHRSWWLPDGIDPSSAFQPPPGPTTKVCPIMANP